MDFLTKFLFYSFSESWIKRNGYWIVLVDIAKSIRTKRFVLFNYVRFDFNKPHFNFYTCIVNISSLFSADNKSIIPFKLTLTPSGFNITPSLSMFHITESFHSYFLFLKMIWKKACFIRQWLIVRKRLIIKN